MHNLAHQYRESLLAANVFSHEEVEKLSHIDSIKPHSFYLDLPGWLAPLNPEITAQTIARIRLIGFCMLKGLLYFDDLLDKGHVPSYNYGLVHYQQAVCMMSALSSLPESFLTRFGALQKRYFHAIHTERKWSERSCIDVALFERVSADKSAIVELIPMLLAGDKIDEAHWQSVIESLRWLHIGMQYIDDIKDVKRDIEEKQITFVYLETIKRIGHTADSTANLTPTSIVQYMAMSGEAERHLDYAVRAYKSALAVAKPLGLPEYVCFLEGRIASVQRMLSDTQELRQQAVERAEIRALPLVSLTLDLAVDVTAARSRGAGFLLGKISDEGTLRDFKTDQGYSDVWLSAFVCCNLLQSGYDDPCLMALALRLSSLPSGTQGFNSNTPADGDTLSFLIHLNWLTRKSVPKQLLNDWISHQDGGAWQTYRPGAIRPMLDNEVLASQGWCGTHMCVTAVAAVVLSAIQTNFVPPECSLDHLANAQTSEGNWSAYWWTEDEYATAHAIAALTTSPGSVARHRSALERGVNWLYSRQNTDGSWSKGDNRAFYTSIALIGLLSASLPYDPLYTCALRKGVEWLLHQQKVDGRWVGGRCLRVPHPSIEMPSTVARWRNASTGYNICVQEQHGYLTTSLAIYALSLYSKMFAGHLCR